jgi:hypothetical protein
VLPTTSEADSPSAPSRTPEADVDSQYEAEPVATSDFWTVGDQLGYRDYADAIAAFIQHEDTRPPLTIGIKAAWGAGKTSLMRMVQNVLDPAQDSSGRPEGRVPIRLSSESRRLLAGRRRRRSASASAVQDLEHVTVGTVLRQLRSDDRADDVTVRARPPSAHETHGLEGEQDWRATVWFNPWMYESGEQVWAGFAHELISQITQRMPIVEREHFWLSLNLARVDENAVRRRLHRILFERLLPVALMLAALCVAALVALGLEVSVGLSSGLQTALSTVFSAGGGAALLVAIIRTVRLRAESASSSLDRLVREPNYSRAVTGQFKWDDIVKQPMYEDRLGLLYLVHADIRRVLDLVATPERPLVIFVDDLDRCSPSTVTQVIEAINLFLAGEFPNCVFVIAMEPEVVAAHIEVAHQPLVDMLAARGFDERAGTLGWRFLEKIVQLPLSLPIPAKGRVGDFLSGVLVPVTSSSGEQVPEREPVEEEPRAQSARSDRKAQAAAGKLSLDDRDAALARDTRRAMSQEFGRRLKRDSPEVRAIVAAFAGQLDGTPREVKRFVNVFRFYAFIHQNRAVSGRTPRASLIQVAKLAMLAVRWPHLRGILGTGVPLGEHGSVLELLESLLRETDSAAAESDIRDALDNQLAVAGVRPAMRTAVLDCDDLCAFLAGPPRIDASVASLL